jgi:SAM-dependent methyltransferase
MEKKKRWHDDDDFWMGVDPVLFPKERILRASEEIGKFIKLAKIKKGTHILDLCCGVGRHSIDLAKRGFKVTAVDRTESYLRKAKKRARKERVRINFIKSDMREFRRPNTFNGILNLYTSFGYFEDKDDDRKVAKNMFDSLKRKGKLVIEMMGKEVLARIYRERGWAERDGIVTLEERKITKNWSWMDNRWIILKGNTRKEFRITHRLYSAVELSELLTECGFLIKNVYGNLNGDAYDHKAIRMIVVAQKP